MHTLLTPATRAATLQEYLEESNEVSATVKPLAKKAKKGPMAYLRGDVFSVDNTYMVNTQTQVNQRTLSLQNRRIRRTKFRSTAWWNAQRLAYLIISKLIQKQFSMVATSVPSERTFTCSSAGHTTNDK